MSQVGQKDIITQNRVVPFFTKELGYRYLGYWKDREGNSNIRELDPERKKILDNLPAATWTPVAVMPLAVVLFPASTDPASNGARTKRSDDFRSSPLAGEFARLVSYVEVPVPSPPPSAAETGNRIGKGSPGTPGVNAGPEAAARQKGCEHP